MTFGIAKRPVTGCFVIVAMWFLFTAILMNGCEIVFVGQKTCVNDLFFPILKYLKSPLSTFHLE